MFATSNATLLLYRCSVPLGPFSHDLALDLATGQLRYFFYEHDSSYQLLVLGYARRQPIPDILGCHFALGRFLQHNVRPGPLVAVSFGVIV